MTSGLARAEQASATLVEMRECRHAANFSGRGASGSVPDLGSGGCRFKSCCSDQFYERHAREVMVLWRNKDGWEPSQVRSLLSLVVFHVDIIAGVVQLAETWGLKPHQCGFESRFRHQCICRELVSVFILGDIVIYHVPACDYPAMVIGINEDQSLNLCVFTGYETGSGETLPGSGLSSAHVSLARHAKQGDGEYEWSYR